MREYSWDIISFLLQLQPQWARMGTWCWAEGCSTQAWITVMMLQALSSYKHSTV